MDRDEAIAILRKEYLCVDRDCDIEKNCGKCDLVMPSKEPILEAFKMAIEALEQEPCEDAISRKAAIENQKIIYKEYCKTDNEKALMEELARINQELPSVNPQPCEDCISREAVDTLVDELARAISDERCHIPRGRSAAIIMQDLLDLPSVNPQEQKVWRWIPVEKLPEKSGRYLVVISGTGDDLIDTAYFAGGMWYKGRIKAWMPVPPYKEESEG